MATAMWFLTTLAFGWYVTRSPTTLRCTARWARASRCCSGCTSSRSAFCAAQSSTPSSTAGPTLISARRASPRRRRPTRATTRFRRAKGRMISDTTFTGRAVVDRSVNPATQHEEFKFIHGYSETVPTRQTPSHPAGPMILPSRDRIAAPRSWPPWSIVQHAGCLPQADAGRVDVARLNFSHGSHAQKAELIRMVRKSLGGGAQGDVHSGRSAGSEDPYRQTQGPQAGATGGWEHLTITPKDVHGTASLVGTTFKTLAENLEPGSRILLSDGLIELLVERIDGGDVICEM